MTARTRIAAWITIVALVAGGDMLRANAESSTDNYKPPSGYVPDAETAIKIAIAVWEPIYGHKQLDHEKPYTAILRAGVWTVEGSLPPHYSGGVALAEIAKEDGRILRVTHGR